MKNIKLNIFRRKKYGANFVDVVLNDYQNVDDTIG